MTLNGHFLLHSIFTPERLASETLTFESNCVKTNPDRPILCQQQTRGLGTLVSGNIKFVRIFVGFSKGGTSSDSAIIGTSSEP